MAVVFQPTGNFDAFEKGCKQIAKHLGILFAENGIPLRICDNAEQLLVQQDGEGYTISCSDKTEFFRGLAFLSRALKKGENCELSEKKRFETCGMMFDLSRSAVYKVETVQTLLNYMASMGLNRILLYTEDTYEMEKYPDFGYLRGAYSEKEIKTIVDYADAFGIEVVPCIQTLGHMASALRWPSLNRFGENKHVLFTGEDETYAFIEDMFKTCAKCFKSRRIHIGFDEAYGLGRGKYLQKNGFRELKDIFFEHMAKVCEIAKKYGFTPMIWNDMIFKLDGSESFLLDGNADKLDVSAELYNRYPENLELVYYNYGGPYRLDDRVNTEFLLQKHAQFHRHTLFGGSVWTWTRTCVGLKKTHFATLHQLQLCEKYGIDSVFGCIWNDNNHQMNQYAFLPGMQIWAELLYHADADMEFIWNRFEACTGFDKEEWKLLYFDDFSDADMEQYLDQYSYCVNPSYAHLYNDVLTGLLDKTMDGYDFKSRYKEFLNQLEKVDGGEMKPLFDRYRSMYEILYVKCDLGIELRKAYQNGDKEKMRKLYAELLKLPNLYKKYHQCVENDWYSLNKPFGYSGLDISLGMIEARINTAISVIGKYLSGELDELPELACDIHYFMDRTKPLTEVGPVLRFVTATNVELP